MCTVMLSAPARAISSICRSGRSIIRWTSIIAWAAWTRSAIAATATAPKVIGGTKCPSITSTWITRAPAARASDRPQHAAVAVVALHDRRARHAHDRRVLTAVGTHRHQLEAVQAVDASVAAGHRGGSQPRLTAVRALDAEPHRQVAHGREGNGWPSRQRRGPALPPTAGPSRPALPPTAGPSRPADRGAMTGPADAAGWPATRPAAGGR